MYEKLVESLRNCVADENGCCSRCPEDCNGPCQENLMTEAANAIEELATKLATLQDRCKWISVTERLPKDGEFVLVCNDDGHMLIAKHETETYEWYYKYTNYDFDIWDNEEQGPVCYWMPLPEPPKEET